MQIIILGASLGLCTYIAFSFLGAFIYKLLQVFE